MSKQRTPWHFSYYKVVKFGSLTPFQWDIFLAMLGYREICQCHSWEISRSSAPRQFFWEPFLTGLKGIETVCCSMFWNTAGKKNKISPILKVLGIAIETKIWFVSLKTWKDLGYLFVFLLKGFIHLFKSHPTLSQTQGRESEQNHISSPMVFCSCSYYLVSRVRKPAFEFWIHYILGNYRHRISFHCLSNGDDILSISQGSYENQIRWYIIQILQCKAYFCAFHAFSFKLQLLEKSCSSRENNICVM